MPRLRINATDDGLQQHGSAVPLAAIPQDMMAQGSAAVILVHGYKYEPGHPSHCPHHKIFNDGPDGWPNGVQRDGTGKDRLIVAFGWPARGALVHTHRRAAALGRALAILVQTLREAAPHRPVHIMAHSLGSEIALSALAYLPAYAVQRMVLLTGASFTTRAQDMIATAAGRTTEVFNITSRENDLFDLMFETLIPAPRIRDRAIGQGLVGANVVNLQLDCPATLDALAHLDLPIAHSARRICHWSSYTRPGVMALYSRLLHGPSDLRLGRLTAMLPRHAQPRWSQLRTFLPDLQTRPPMAANWATAARHLCAKTYRLWAAQRPDTPQAPTLTCSHPSRPWTGKTTSPS
ncbi:alpha/beta hydrolase [Roseobacter sp.]|uniref:alpha/beta hydrolase n=1 Tax=Roseobacter sp. TaxID=1907202 RepID=UPI00329A5B6D